MLRTILRQIWRFFTRFGELKRRPSVANKGHSMDVLEILARNYEPIFTGRFDTGPKQFVGPINPDRCRFCDKSAPEVSFRNEAHAIPELLGNRQLIVTDECDICNALFSQSLEDHLGKFTKPFRIVGQVRGKTGVPSYKTPKGLSRIDFIPGKGFQIQEHSSDPFVDVVEEENHAKYNFILERHVPSAVYKALVKIALSVMPADDLKNFAHAKKWIRHRDHRQALFLPLKLLYYFIPGPKPHETLAIMLLRKKANSDVVELPWYHLVLAFGNVQFQIMVPSLGDNRSVSNQAQFLLPRFPSAFGNDWPYGAPKATEIDLSSGESAAPRKFTLIQHLSSTSSAGSGSEPPDRKPV